MITRKRLRELRAIMLALEPWMRCTYNPLIGQTYQACRFCRRGWHDGVEGLWKYGVRHYACDECKKALQIGVRPATP